MKKVLVLGASGFLGSHIVKLLVEKGCQVRILIRPSSDTRATDDLPIERLVGNPLDEQDLRQAMQGCDTVFHSIVDARAWLRDPAPLYRVNIDGLRASMDAALSAGVSRFVFTSTYAIIGKSSTGLSTEENEFHWDDGEPPAYVKCRAEAEALMMRYCQEKGLPGIACNVGNTYGEADYQPTPHGKLLYDVARGRLPFYWDGGGPSLNIKDAAQGMVLAAEKGKTGERYIFGGEYVTFQDLFAMAASAAGRKPPRLHVSDNMLALMGYIAEAFTRPLGIENKMNKAAIDCSKKLPAVSSQKAIEELGWRPGPIEQAVDEAVSWYLANL
ncbi:MAG: NAD-dependent epimerase/dehydratase family protein [Ketobacteraceae bacterium]|nr:NAD-dependent epimerase/dehydratase family protein [Ketobacteraceae bacterium]